jgi:hypothetical protein
MGRQVQLHVLPEDVTTLLAFLRAKDAADVAYRSADSAEITALANVPYKTNGSLILWNHNLAPQPQRGFIAQADPPSWLADEQTETILQLSMSALQEWNGSRALLQGRLYGVFDGKPPAFEKWYDRIVRYIRSHWRKNPISWMSGYVAPKASEFFESGGILLPNYAPPVTAEWIERLGEQHKTIEL